MKFRHTLAASAALIPLALLSTPAFAQSTGSADFDDEIIVTGSISRDVAGIKIPDSPKAKVVVGAELIQRQRPGQSINEIINLVPGVSFTNNDPWGSSGGNFTIRGFDSSRISQTFDGIPLNDSGNYAVYTNQQVDPELVKEINVNLGSTDVDSPTAAAVGGTVNINTLVPSEELSAMVSASYGNIIAKGAGDRPYYRVFGLIQTGNLTPWGTRAWFSASTTSNVAAFANYGDIKKQQYNGKIYQPIGDNGDFIAIAGHYNENRNNFGGSPLKANAITGDKHGRFYDIGDPTKGGGFPCTLSTTSVVNNCGTEFERRYNPSNTGNIRWQSRFTLTDRLTLSFDGAWQTVKANGGGTTDAFESVFTKKNEANGLTFTGTGNYGGKFYFGRDLNGDGILGKVTLLSPSQTNTNRWVAIANLVYDINDTNRVRLSYSYDRARHRQTGAAGFLFPNGEPTDVFPINDPVTDVNGNVLQKRDRLSFATLNQVAGEYRGEFFEEKLIVQLGLRAPFFKRDLNNHCFTSSTGGATGAFVECVPADQIAAYQKVFPYAYNATTGRPSGAALPQERTLKYDKLLPNVGAVYKITPDLSLAASYTKNLSVPSTDSLYSAFFFPADDISSERTAETSDSFDVGIRYQTSKVQAALTGWYSKYNNRLVTSYDIDGNGTDTNLGPVKKYGIDASIAYQPIEQVSLYVFGSYLKSKIEHDAITSGCAVDSDIQLAGLCYIQDGTAYLRTSGKRERNAPEFLFGGRAQGNFGDFTLGVQAKYTGSRFMNDINGDVGIAKTSTGATKLIAPGAKFKGYTVVDIDVRYSLASAGLEHSYLQLNISNLFDKFYVGSFSGSLDGLASASGAFVNFGSPRAISASFVIGF